MKHLHTKLAAIATAGVLAGSDAAHAQGSSTNFSTLTESVVQSSSTLPNLISTVAYVGGIGLGVAGIFKLKQHVDQPAQNPMKDGLVRLGAGGGLLALPFMTNAMKGTIQGDGDGTAVAPSSLQFEAATFSGGGGGN